jgi:inosine-uridine nucleoside N-ribohydrolase
MQKINIHYDCDPGQDDAIALLYALGAGVTVESLSIVGGNVDVNKCTRNA